MHTLLIYPLIVLMVWFIISMTRKALVKVDIRAKEKSLRLEQEIAENLPEVDAEQIEENRKKISDFKKT